MLMLMQRGGVYKVKSQHKRAELVKCRCKCLVNKQQVYRMRKNAQRMDSKTHNGNQIRGVRKNLRRERRLFLSNVKTQQKRTRK
jgi:hypothetical protein